MLVRPPSGMRPDNMPRGRRNTSRPRRRRFTGINLWNTAESLVQANIITQNFFGTDPLAFLVGKTSSGYGQAQLAVSNTGQVRIGIGELIGLTNSGEANRTAAWNNMKRNWLKTTGQVVGTRVGFMVAKKLTRKFRSQMNAGIKMVGLGNEVRV